MVPGAAIVRAANPVEEGQRQEAGSVTTQLQLAVEKTAHC